MTIHYGFVDIAIKQEKTVVQWIEFENRLCLRVADAVALQDAAAIVSQDIN